MAQEESMVSPKALPKLRTTTDQQGASARPRADTAVPNDHEKAHLHRRLQSTSLRNRAFTGAKDYRHAAKETVQSALELKPPISFDSLLRREKKGHDSGRHGSSRHISRRQQETQQRNVDEWAIQQVELARRPQVKSEDVEKAKRDNVKREKGLRTSLSAVEDVAMSSTRQLDDTYYAILERASLLRNTVASLQQLTEESRRMHSGFEEETKQLEQSIISRFDGFANFDPQEVTINSLVDQLKHSKQNADELNDRLEAARNRVEAYEQREKKKQKTSRQRWSAVWVTLAGLAVLIVALILAKSRAGQVQHAARVVEVVDELGHEMSGMLLPKPKTEDDTLRQLFDNL